MPRHSLTLATAVMLSFGSHAFAQGTPTPPPATSSVPANRLANQFASLAGSFDNSLALVTALRTGMPVTFTTTPPCPAPCTTPPPDVKTTIDVPTRPMGWGNVRHTLALAQFALAKAGITNPTPDQLAAALDGGTVKNDAGKSVELKGILTLRAGGMGWGQIAHAEGTTLGKVNQPLKPFNTVTSGSGSTATTTASGKSVGITTGSGTSVGTVSAAGGKSFGASQAGRGIVTAGGGSVSPGVATGNGNANAGGNGAAHAGRADVNAVMAGNRDLKLPAILRRHWHPMPNEKPAQHQFQAEVAELLTLTG